MITAKTWDFSANLSFLWTQRPFLERFAAAAAAGFEAVEFHFPYAFDAQEIAAAALDAGVRVVLFNVPAGDWAAGERGIAALPDRVAEFQEGVDRAIEYALALDCPRVNVLAGIAPVGAATAWLRDTLVANLAHAADRAAPHGLNILLEPLNTVDTPGFFVSRTAQAREIVNATARDNVFIQYDLYHAQVMEGDLARTLAAHLPRIGHIQLADNPGRHEPGTGEIHFPFLFAQLDALGYRGWVGCEYKPSTATTEQSLAWMPAR